MLQLQNPGLCQPLPNSTDINLWNSLECFDMSYSRTPKIIVDEKNFSNIIKSLTAPTIISMPVELFNQDLHRPDILFGQESLKKLMVVELNGNPHYFQGLWYFMLSDFKGSIKIAKNSEELEYVDVGYGFEKVANPTYIFKWGTVLRDNVHYKERGLIRVTDGYAIYIRST
jgi:hypothetical protein